MTIETPIIDTGRFYSLNELQELKLIPTVTSRRAIREKLEYELTLEPERRILNASYEGEGNSRRYYIKGENIIKYIVRLEEGGSIY